MRISLALRRRHDDLGNAPDLLSLEDAEKIDRGEYVRTSGDALCECGRKHREHDPVIGALWLTRLCDGRLVKL